MEHKTDRSGLTSEQEIILLSLLRTRSKAAAARAANVSRGKVYRCLADPQFMAAYRAARRAAFDGALATLETRAPKAAWTLIDELNPKTWNSILRSRVLGNTAKAVLDLAFRSREHIAMEEELANLQATIENFAAGQMPATPTNPPAETERLMMTGDEQAEACRLRAEWMAEIGMDGSSLADSLHYNRPQSVAAEQHLLDVVLKLLEVERTYAQ